MTTKPKRVRQPKPKTAYDLLNRVCAHIREEPKRYNQERFITHGRGNIRAQFGFAPSCGTMACRAGWIVALHDGPERTKDEEAADRADEIMGMPSTMTMGLYNGAAVDKLAGRNMSAKVGTPEYARLGVKGLRAFMKRHATRLKTRMLADVPKLEE